MGKENVIFTVPDMSCSHCENAIKKALGNLNGVDDVHIDLDCKKVSVEFDEAKVSLDTLKVTIEDQGYTVN